MSIYYSHDDDEGKLFKMKYVNPYPEEHKNHLEPQEIEEEEETNKVYSEEFKNVLSFK